MWLSEGSQKGNSLRPFLATSKLFAKYLQKGVAKGFAGNYHLSIDHQPPEQMK
jgi:hypothetical protein